MAETVTFTGMILTASPMKEFDKRVEVLTKKEVVYQRLQGVPGD